jgi:hypothetical protein
MKATCDIILEFDDVEKVKTVMRSVKVDDFNFVKSSVKGKKLEAHIDSKSVSSLLHTLDDYLACISIADKIVE